MTYTDYNDALLQIKSDPYLIKEMNHAFKGLGIIEKSIDDSSPLDMLTGILRSILTKHDKNSIELLRRSAIYMELCFIIKIKYSKDPCYEFSSPIEFVKILKNVGVKGDFKMKFPKSVITTIDDIFAKVDGGLGDMFTDVMSDNMNMEQIIHAILKIRKLEGGRNRRVSA